MNARAEKHTPGPWECITRQGSWDWLVYSKANSRNEICQMFHDNTEFNETGEANARLVAAAPEMLAALRNVQKLISEAAMTGFNWKDGDWAEKLFASQQMTSRTIAKAVQS